MSLDVASATTLFGIDRNQFMAELQKITQNLSRAQTTHGFLVNLTYLFLTRAHKKSLVHVQQQQIARQILEDAPKDASEIYWFASIVSAFLVQHREAKASTLFDFLKKNKEHGETTFRNKIEIYVQERAAQRFPDEPKADYALADAMRYVAKFSILEREQLEKIAYYLNHYHPAAMSLFTQLTSNIKLFETPPQIIKRKIALLRQALSQFNEAKIAHDLEIRMLNLKRLKEAEIKVFIHLFDLSLYLGPHDPLHQELEPIQKKIEQNFQAMLADFLSLHKKNLAKSGEISRRHLLEKEQEELATRYNQLKEINASLKDEQESLEEETQKYRKQKVTQDAIKYLQQKIIKLEKENSQLMDDYYSFKVKLLNIVPADSEQDRILEAEWQNYLSQKQQQPIQNISLYDSTLHVESEESEVDIPSQEVDEDLLDEPTKINLAEVSPAALKILNNRLHLQNQKLDEITLGMEQQNKLVEKRIAKLNELKNSYFNSEEFDTELEKQSLESHCKILIKDKNRNMERLRELEWKFKKLLDLYDGDKTETQAAITEFETKYPNTEQDTDDEETVVVADVTAQKFDEE